MTTLLRGGLILTMDSDSPEPISGDILIKDQTIAAVGSDLQVPADTPDLRVIDARGKLVLPGLVNGHFHSPGNFLKGTLDGLPLELFMLYEVPPLAASAVDSRHIYVRTMLGALEMLKRGVTAVHDDVYHIPRPTPDAIDAVNQAYGDSGMRAVTTINQPNVVEYEKYPFLRDLLPPDVVQRMDQAPIPPESELIACYRHLIGKWNGAYGGRLKAGLSISAPQRVTESYFEALSEMSQTLDLPLNMHILETKLQRVFGRERYGMSIVQRVAELGHLFEQVLVIHAIWVDAADIELLADSGCTVAHNPLCNLRLGSGIMPFRRMVDHGVPICLGSDEACSDDSVNMWLVAKMAGLVHNVSDPEYRNWPQAREILWALIRGGARGMRNQDRVGVLAPGYDADLITLDLDSYAFTPLNDIYRQLVYNEIGTSVELVMVAGEIVMEDGKIRTVDEDALKREARSIMDTHRQELAAHYRDAAYLMPYYRDAYMKAAGERVGMTRRAFPDS